MDAKEIKEYIVEHNLLQDILKKIGCHSFIPYNKELRCALPDDDDNSKVSVFYDNNISVRIFTKGETIFGSIYDLIMHIYNISFTEAYKKCAALLGLSTYNCNSNKIDHLSFFKGIKNKLNKNDEKQVDYFDLEILKKYSSTPHIDLIRKDGILQNVIDKYHIMFDERTDRIIFPHFKHDDKNKIVGIIGRTVNPAFKELNIPKYFSLEGLRYEKSKNLYGLSHNKENIVNHKQVIVYEAEKSVLKSDMFGYPIGVSVGCHELSDYQVELLLALNSEIIIAFDKGISVDHIINICKKINPYRSVSYIYDKWNLLKESDAPVDRGVKKFEFLFKHRIKV